MRTLTLALVCAILMAITALAENCPPIEVYGQYSHMSVDLKGIVARQGANGWEVGMDLTFTRLFAVEFDGSGYYDTYFLAPTTTSLHDYLVLGGPRLNFKPFFVHALFGGDHLSSGVFGSAVSQQGFTGALGGGVDWKVKAPWSLHVSADYVFNRRSVLSGSAFGQNDFRASVGIGYTFGKRSNSGY